MRWQLHLPHDWPVQQAICTHLRTSTLGCHVAGAPESGTVQEVLHFQTQTIRMMYRIVAEVQPALLCAAALLCRRSLCVHADAWLCMHAQALRQTRSKAHPRDYLNFFCPMKREVKHPGEPEPAKQPPKDSDQVRGAAQLATLAQGLQTIRD